MNNYLLPIFSCFLAGIFHVQEVTVKENIITCTFADQSDAHGCLVRVFSHNADNTNGSSEMNEICTISIIRSESSTAHAVVPNICELDKNNFLFDLFVYDIFMDGHFGLNVAQIIDNISLQSFIQPTASSIYLDSTPQTSVEGKNGFSGMLW